MRATGDGVGRRRCGDGVIGGLTRRSVPDPSGRQPVLGVIDHHLDFALYLAADAKDALDKRRLGSNYNALVRQHLLNIALHIGVNRDLYGVLPQHNLAADLGDGFHKAVNRRGHLVSEITQKPPGLRYQLVLIALAAFGHEHT